jgi:hypothetical protein
MQYECEGGSEVELTRSFLFGDLQLSKRTMRARRSVLTTVLPTSSDICITRDLFLITTDFNGFASPLWPDGLIFAIISDHFKTLRSRSTPNQSTTLHGCQREPNCNPGDNMGNSLRALNLICFKKVSSGTSTKVQSSDLPLRRV